MTSLIHNFMCNSELEQATRLNPQELMMMMMITLLVRPTYT